SAQSIERFWPCCFLTVRQEFAMLDDAILETLLCKIPSLRVGVIGDLFLDRYLEIDHALTEPSIETGLDAYQVVKVRSIPGAAGTVINNLVALGVAAVHAVAVIGDDGEGYELRQALKQLGVVDDTGVFAWEGRRTPTYTKPMLHDRGKLPRELNRLDIKNRSPLAPQAQEEIFHRLEKIWPEVDALLVLDQVSEPECGVIAGSVRERLTQLGEAQPDRLILADSRERVHLFQGMTVKPNQRECLRAVGSLETGDLDEAIRELANRTKRPVFCTCGEQGIVLIDPRGGGTGINQVPGYPVQGPIDVVGAGDSTSAAIACALATGASLQTAAAFGNLVASITIQQIGTTGTASPEQIRGRWREIQGSHAG
ncbi:MAG TPA: PfkB family carbohydrate kinase, partial [Gemmataceae bacterium]|nr:PfkB family carbohydrate kinase [Gemmataceae bacterium]